MPKQQPFALMPNTYQSPEERAGKYALARANGLNPSWAQAVRDWRQITLDNFLEMLYISRKEHPELNPQELMTHHNQNLAPSS